jgi:hypothetical protein
VLADKLRPEHIRGFAQHMAAKYDVVFVTNGTKDLKDQLRKAILKVNPQVDIDAYFARWAFTLGNLIWTPFSIEDPKELPVWPYYWQFITIAHEVHHRVQFKEHGGAPFAWDYLSNEESRGQYEYEAYRTALELYPVLMNGESLDPVLLSQSLVHYGCSPATIDFVASQLTQAKKIIQAGGTITGTSQEAVVWLADHVF